MVKKNIHLRALHIYANSTLIIEDCREHTPSILD